MIRSLPDAKPMQSFTTKDSKDTEGGDSLTTKDAKGTEDWTRVFG
jgi:hypothetical protein